MTANPSAALTQGDVETVTRTWEVYDDDAVLTAPDAITFTARSRTGVDVTWGTAGSGADHETVIDDADGTGTWTVAAGQLDVGAYKWWALVTIGSSIRIPRRDADVSTSTGLTGTLSIEDN